MDVAIYSPELLKRDEGNDGRRSSADQRRRQTMEHPQETLSLEDSGQHCRDAVVALDGHQTSFEDIQWTADEGRQESSETACSNMGRNRVGHGSAPHEFPLDDIVTCKLGSRSDSSSACADPDSSKQT